MKNILKYSGWLIASALGIALLVVLLMPHDHDHTTGDGHNHGEDAHDDHAEASSTVKEVGLNQAQFDAAGIKMSGFFRKNLSEVIKVSGYTKLPPQNKAAVSAPLSGLVKNIHVVEGQYVKAGQPLATLQSLEYNNLRLEREKMIEQLTGAEAHLTYLKLEYNRQKELSEENVSAKKVFEKISADLALEETKIKSLKAQIAILTQNIEIGGNAASAIVPVVAAISGYISKIEVNIGSTASPGLVLFEIVDNSKIHIDLQVYEKDIYKVKPGQKVRFMLTNQGKEELVGTIFSTSQALDEKTKTIAVHAEIDNPEKSLIVGMYINGVVDLGTKEVDALPADAIIKAEGREFVFVQKTAVHNHDHHEGHNHDDHEGHDHEEEAAAFTFQRMLHNSTLYRYLPCKR